MTSTGEGRLSFGVNLGRAPGEALQAARWAEDAGFDVVTAADHLGSISPFVLLSAAAAVTVRIRLRTYVLDYGFWNPALLARDVATLDALSGGRVEIGLGAGHMRHEHEDAGLAFPPFGERMAALGDFTDELRRRLGDPGHYPEPVQRPVPVFVAAMSERGLDLAARLDGLVGLSGALQVPGRPAGTLRLATAAETDERVARVRKAREDAGAAPARFDALLQQVVLGRDPQEVAREWVAQDEDAGPDPDRAVADLLESPFVLWAATADDAVEELLRRSTRWGITSWCTHSPSGAALAEVIAALQGRTTP